MTAIRQAAAALAVGKDILLHDANTLANTAPGRSASGHDQIAAVLRFSAVRRECVEESNSGRAVRDSGGNGKLGRRSKAGCGPNETADGRFAGCAAQLLQTGGKITTAW